MWKYMLSRNSQIFGGILDFCGLRMEVELMSPVSKGGKIPADNWLYIVNMEKVKKNVCGEKLADYHQAKFHRKRSAEC